MAKKEPRQLSLFSNIEMYNLMVDRTSLIRRLGKNGILYEYELPYGVDITRYYEQALNVRSIKGENTNPSRAKGKEGKVYRPGTYQPIGDKRYFTYYQLSKMNAKERMEFAIEVHMKRQLRKMLKEGLK
jgi:hypothetical protein